MASEESRHQIIELVHRMNDAWVSGNPEALASFFREDIVMVNPDFSQRTQGREACVASYSDFRTQALIQGFKIGELTVDAFDTTAVAVYSYEIAYQMGGENFNDHGRDIFVFERSRGEWQAAWRTMIVSQAASVN